MSKPRVFVHIVTWNSTRYLRRCAESVLQQAEYHFGENLALHITDNDSSDEVMTHFEELSSRGVTWSRNSENLGFCAAHNQGVYRAMQGGYDYILILNPDVVLEPNCIARLVTSCESVDEIGCATPKLLRADRELNPIHPPHIDAAGMQLFPSLRHFDRGSGEIDSGQYDTPQYVFGGTGACLLLSLATIGSLTLPRVGEGRGMFLVYPELSRAAEPRVQIFDEAFFAYREDADLAWRMRLSGWRCVYVPSAVGYHVRVVLPENRSEVSPRLNQLSVKNRFLLQLNNWNFSVGEGTLSKGIIIRNLLVVAGVLVKEWRSIPGLFQALLLTPRAIRNRLILRARRTQHDPELRYMTLTQLNDDSNAFAKVDKM